jgi:hypothetical protein
VRHVERHRPAAVRWIERRRHGEASRLGELDQSRRLTHALLADVVDTRRANDARTLDCREQRRNRRRAVQPAPRMFRVFHVRLEPERPRVRLPPSE